MIPSFFWQYIVKVNNKKNCCRSEGLATMNRPAPVELCHKNMRFLITHNPTDSTLSSFIEVQNINVSSQNLHEWSSVCSRYQSGFHIAIFFSQDLKRYGATTVVRVCDITYDKAPLEKDGINVVVRAPENTHQRHLHHSGAGSVLLQFFPGLAIWWWSPSSQ